MVALPHLDGAAARHGRARPTALAAARRRAADRSRQAPARKVSRHDIASRVARRRRARRPAARCSCRCPRSGAGRRSAASNCPPAAVPLDAGPLPGRHAPGPGPWLPLAHRQATGELPISTGRCTPRSRRGCFPARARRQRSRRATCSRSSSTCSTPTFARAWSRRSCAPGRARCRPPWSRDSSGAWPPSASTPRHGARFVPEFQIASLAVMAARRDGLDPSYAIDLVLALIARDFGKATASLETPEAQIAALRMPTRASDDRVRHAAASTSSSRAGRGRCCAPGERLERRQPRRARRLRALVRLPRHRRRARCVEAPRSTTATRSSRRRSTSVHTARRLGVRRRRQPAHDRPDAGCLR